jgi:hypothetical protein
VHQTFDPQILALAIANGIGYVLLGMLFFNLITRRVKAKGLLGGH